MQEKEDFWRELDQNLERIERDEKVVIGGDLNGQVGAAKRGNEHVLGSFGVGEEMFKAKCWLTLQKEM